MNALIDDFESDPVKRKDTLFDLRPVLSAGIDNLNRLQFEQEYLTSAFDPEILRRNLMCS